MITREAKFVFDQIFADNEDDLGEKNNRVDWLVYEFSNLAKISSGEARILF